MRNATSRHVDTGAWLLSFADQVLVCCPRCEAPGVAVTTGRLGWPSASTEFACERCGLKLASQNGDWIGPMAVCGRRACGFCGHRWLHAEGPVEQGASPPASLTAVCAVCGHESMVSVEPLRVMPVDRAIEPHLGLPLLLAAPTRHGTVWAYNERHLRELQSYVGAKLRLRGAAGNGSMFSRLPAWMKSAKNRDAILKSLARLEAKLPQEAPRRRSAGGPAT